MMDDVKRKRHDAFNLVCLPFVIFFNLWFLADPTSKVAEYGQFGLFFAYMVVDSLWVYLVPDSVASPGTILAHHYVVLFVWIVPFFQGSRTLIQYSSYGPLVEINTFCLIARRNVQRFELLQAGFYVSWVGLRVLFYPYVLYHYVAFLRQCAEGSPPCAAESAASFFYPTAALILAVMLFLNTLNAKWTYDLYHKTFKNKENKFL